MSNVQLSCFVMSYLVAFALEVMRLLRRGILHRGVMLAFGWAGFLAHTIYLLARSQSVDLPPLLSSAQDWMLVLAWLAVLFYLFGATLDRDFAVGLFLLPIVLLLIAGAVLVHSTPNPLAGDELLRRWIMLHVSLMVFGAAGALFSLVFGLMYLVQHRRLRTKRVVPTGLSLPSLEWLAKFNWWSVVVSVPLLTCGLVTGVILLRIMNAGGAEISLADPIVLASAFVWIVMAVFFFWVVSSPKAAGKQVASLTIWACSFMLVSLIASNMLSRLGGLDTWHQPAVPVDSSETAEASADEERDVRVERLDANGKNGGVS